MTLVTLELLETRFYITSLFLLFLQADSEIRSVLGPNKLLRSLSKFV